MATQSNILPYPATSNQAAYQLSVARGDGYQNETEWAWLSTPNISATLPVRTVEDMQTTIRLNRGTNARSTNLGQDLISLPTLSTVTYDHVTETLYRRAMGTAIADNQKLIQAERDANEDTKKMIGYVMAEDENMIMFNNCPTSVVGPIGFVNESPDTVTAKTTNVTTYANAAGIYERLTNPGKYKMQNDLIISASMYDLRPTSIADVQNLAIQTNIKHMIAAMTGSGRARNVSVNGYVNEDAFIELETGWVGKGNGVTLSVSQDNFRFRLIDIDGVKIFCVGRYTPDVDGNQYQRVIPNNPDPNGTPWGGGSGVVIGGQLQQVLDVPLSFSNAGTKYAIAAPNTQFAGQALYTNMYFIKTNEDAAKDDGSNVKEISIEESKPMGFTKLELKGARRFWDTTIANQNFSYAETIYGYASPDPRCLGMITGLKVAGV